MATISLPTTNNQQPTTRQKYNPTHMSTTNTMMFSAESSSDEDSPSPSPIISPALSSTSPVSTPSTAVSLAEPEPTLYHVFEIEAPRGHRKLFLSIGPQPAIGFFFFVLHLIGIAQPMMVAMVDTVTSFQQLAMIFDSRLVGSIAAHDLTRFRMLIRGFGVPFCPLETDPPTEALRRAERWVHDVIVMLLEDGVLRPPPPPRAAHQLPRHHCHEHCIHQRLHSHHPYRRRGRRPFVNNNPFTNPRVNPARDSRESRDQ